MRHDRLRESRNLDKATGSVPPVPIGNPMGEDAGRPAAPTAVQDIVRKTLALHSPT